MWECRDRSSGSCFWTELVNCLVPGVLARGGEESLGQQTGQLEKDESPFCRG